MNEQDVTPTPCCVIIPAFNEAKTIEDIVRKALQQVSPVVVVDDGSTDGTAEKAEAAGAHVIRNETNVGKGGCLVAGFLYAHEHEIPTVVTMDADGQHDPREIKLFIDAYERTRIPVLIGNRMWSVKNMPLARRWTNRLMSWLLSRVMGVYLPDTQCGFRFYRTDILPYVHTESQRFAAESEILLYLAMRGFRMDAIRITTIYGKEKSRVNPFTDTFRFFSMLIKYARMKKVMRTR